VTGCETPEASSRIDSLDSLSISALRDRTYGGSTLTIEKTLAQKPYVSHMASYQSDGLRVYSRIDIPSAAMPKNGYPVVIFVHGWMGIDAAPDTQFYFNDDSNYDAMIDAYIEAGFVVMTPGWRGHGTVNGVPADGIKSMRAWDNSSYLSPVFYAIDVLNLLDSLSSFDSTSLNLNNINMVSHSQGGDVALIALAIAGEGSRVANQWSAASFWAGCFPTRATQFLTYASMEKTPQSFLSGDGSWNGTAVGANGEANPDFVFGYPPDWIATPHPEDWTWQNDSWSTATVAEVLALRSEQMYTAINTQVRDIDDATYELRVEADGRTTVIHDPRIAAAMSRIDAFDMEEYLSEPISLQHSDRDFYSFPEWNADLCARVNSADGTCYDFEYPGNTHSLGVSEHRWFSSADAVAGFATAVRRDIALFNGKDPGEIR
jgi:hypothetical protein